MNSPPTFLLVNHGCRSRAVRSRRGIVLLVALGMLGLFSILTATYVVFTSQARQTSLSMDRQASNDDRPEDLRGQIISQILVGSSNPGSAAFGQDLLGDLYGVDSVRTRVAHRRVGSAPLAVNPIMRGQLLDNDDPGTANVIETTTLFRFPLRFAADWNSDGAAGGSALDLPENQPGFSGRPIVSMDLTAPAQFDDAYTGRIVTFLDGPLAGNSFRIVRSFGEDSTGATAFTAPADETALQYNLVIDLSELSTREIVINGISYDLWDLARRFPMALLYGPGPDNAPGEAGRNDGVNTRLPDNTTGEVDDLAELGTPDSDDIGYRLVINGQIFNGRGVDAGFFGPMPETNVRARFPDAAGSNRHPTPSDTSTINFPYAAFPGWVDADQTYATQPNSRFVGPAFGSEPDEPYDAPDLENLFLAWQPVDRPTGVAIHGGTGSMAANALINQAIVPSYHRPALFNYLMNEQIDVGGTARSFAEILAGPADPDDGRRLTILTRRIRRACLRPLPFAGNLEDLDGDGEQLDGTPTFSGSNITPILNETLAPAPTTGAQINQLQRLALWLVNGPWDVDNDRDGVPDSIWLDFQLPSITAADGSLIKPLVAPLIEDLDGRINLNTAGTWSQLAYNFFRLDPAQFAPANNLASPTAATYRFLTRGFGVGPAEVNLRLLLDPFNDNHFPWSTVATSGEPNPFIPGVANNQSLMYQLLSSRYGGTGLNVAVPGVDVDTTLPPIIAADDLISRAIYRTRRALHVLNPAPGNSPTPFGFPMDMQGRGEIDRNLNGNLVVTNLNLNLNVGGTTMNETVNEPYEWAVDGPALGNDQPFTIEELIAVFQRNTPGASFARNRLLELLANDLDAGPRNLERKLTVESRSQRAPEFPGYANAIDYFLSQLRGMPGFVDPDAPFGTATAAEREAADLVLKRMIAIELRKGTKLNLNRPLGNGNDETGGTFPEFIDEVAEVLGPAPNFTGQSAVETAFPGFANPSGNVFADNVPEMPGTNDFTDMTPQELLARHIYVLVYSLVRDPGATDITMQAFFPSFPYPPTMALTTPAEFERANRYAARRLAQWAVNVVDYRDHDAVMTRFRFDEDPFDVGGWDDPTVNPGNFFTVWGMEASDLALTESIAIHDMRIADTAVEINDPAYDGEPAKRDGAMDVMDVDGDMDQLRIPLASAFIELMNTRTPQPNTIQTQHYPIELYGFDHDNDVSTALIEVDKLDLSRAVVNPDTGLLSPVWRIAVGVPTDPATPTPHFDSPRWLTDAERLGLDADDPFSTTAGVPQTDIDKAVERYQHTVDFEIGAGGLLAFEDEVPADNRVINLDRVVWFANLDPTDTANVETAGLDPEQIYRNIRAAVPDSRPILAPGQFAVVAPRLTTRVGQKITNNEAGTFIYDASDQRFELAYDANGNNTWTFKYYDLNDVANAPNYFEDNPGSFSARGIVPIVAQALAPHQNDVAAAGWATYTTNVAANRGVDFGFNISAPHPDVDYYPPPITGETLNDTPGPAGNAYPFFDAYYDAETPSGYSLDQPLDDRATSPLAINAWRPGGTHQDAATLFLERLADPTRGYDPVTNPYIAVDTLTIDLTVFSGHQSLDDLATIGGMDYPADPLSDRDGDDVPDADANTRWDTRRIIPDTQRDRYVNTGGTPFVYRALKGYRQNILDTGNAPGGIAHFGVQMQSGVGVAATYDTSAGVDLDATATPFPETLGYFNREWGLPRVSTAAPTELVGLPQNTSFAVDAWLDRDYSSPYEIMAVPATSPARYALELGPGTELDVDLATGPMMVNEARRDFDHLLGFGRNYNNRNPANWGPTPGTDERTGASAGFEQLFDFVDTGAIYADAERWFEPSLVQESISGSTLFNRVTETLRPPFNNITLHRVPGKINLNTTPDYIGVTGPAGTSSTDFDRLETPLNPNTANATTNATRYYPGVTTNNGFLGDGSVYQSLVWGISNFRELDNQYGLPTLEAEANAYASTQDSPFGLNFKGFIESRTGFTQPVAAGALSTPYLELGNRQVHLFYPSRFAGIFAPASARGFPRTGGDGVASIESYLSQNQEYFDAREHGKQLIDMGLLRPHPDLDGRDLDQATYPVGTALPVDVYDLQTEPTVAPNAEWRSQINNVSLFERPEPELHREERLYDRIPQFRYRNTAKLANLTTHHSNVFLVRYTVGYFRVDPASGEVGQEYGIDTGDNVRYQGTAVIDRTIPAAYEPGRPANSRNTVIFESPLE